MTHKVGSTELSKSTVAGIVLRAMQYLAELKVIFILRDIKRPDWFQGL